MAKFSIITPVYNSEKYLSKCIESILNQTYKDWEFIIVDDGSTDSSLTIMQQYACKDNRIIVFSKSNEGPGLTRNCAVQMATGEYIAFLDSDDYVSNDFLERINLEIDSADVDVIFYDLIFEDENGKQLREERMSLNNGLDRYQLICNQMTGKMPWGGCRKVSSLRLIKQWNLHYSSDTVGEEAIFSFELLRHARKVKFVPQILYHYVNHVESQSKKGTQNAEGISVNGWTIVAEKMRNYLIDNKLCCEYKGALNAFGYVALVGWIRCNRHMDYKCLKSALNTRIDEFEANFGWDIKKDCMQPIYNFLLPFVKNRIFIPVYIAAKVKG